MDLCEEVQRRSAQAGPLEATLPAASTPAACHGSPQFLNDGLAALEKLAELNKDLRSAVQRSVEQRMQVERRHSAVKVEHSRGMDELRAELNDASSEVTFVQNMHVMDDEFGSQSSDAWAWAKAAAARQGVVTAQELHAARSVLDESMALEAELHAELSRSEQQYWQQNQLAVPTPRKAPSDAGPLKQMRSEVEALHRELGKFEAMQGQPPDDDYEEESRWLASFTPRTTLRDLSALQAVIDGQARSNAVRREELRHSESELEELRLLASSASSVTFEEERVSSERKAEVQAMQLQAENCESEEALLSAAVEPLGRELDALTERYEEQKRLLAVYTSSIMRGPLPPGNIHQRSQGMHTLIRSLATCFGSAEVAFLSLDPRGIGRLEAADLHAGLLLGARIDYEALTGLQAQELLSPVGFGVSTLTVSDLAACYPNVWAEFGSQDPVLAERLRSLPWSAVTSSQRVFDETIMRRLQTRVRPGDESDSRQSNPWAHGSEGGTGLLRDELEDIVGRRLKGIPATEIDQLFLHLSRRGREIPRNIWLGATEELVLHSPSGQEPDHGRASSARQQPSVSKGGQGVPTSPDRRPLGTAPVPHPQKSSPRLAQDRSVSPARNRSITPGRQKVLTDVGSTTRPHLVSPHRSSNLIAGSQ